MPGAQGQPQNKVPMGWAGLGIQPQGYRDTPPSPQPVNQPSQAIAPSLTTQEVNPPTAGEKPNRDSCGAAQSPSPLPLTPAGGLQTHCQGKGTRHHLCDPAQAGGGAGGSCIHRCGSPTSPQATFPGKAQSVPSVLPSHLSTRSKAVVAQG